MAVSEARIRANQANAALSTGPKTAEGKEKSRQNALKHGLTGQGVVLPVEDAAEVERRFAAFRAELQPSGELGMTLVKRAATLAVRMEKCAEHELKATAERVAQAMAEFEAPEGVDPAEATRLRAEAGRIAAFDPSKEASLHRRYEAAAEGFAPKRPSTNSVLSQRTEFWVRTSSHKKRPISFVANRPVPPTQGDGGKEPTGGCAVTPFWFTAIINSRA